MTKETLRELINAGVLILDGATGTNLQEAGMPNGVCPEQWIIYNDKILEDLQRAYVAAGSNIVYAPTFGANRIKLSEYNVTNVAEINKALVAITKRATDGLAYVAGNMTMTGKQLYPIGDLQFEELIDVYKEQARALVEAGIDLFVVETMMSLQETRAAIIAIKETTPNLPIFASMTFEPNGRTLYGATPESAIVTLQALGADAVGTNCSAGPMEMLDIVRRMKKYAKVPILAKPNAGLPKFVNGKTVFDMTPKEFAAEVKELINAGANIVGGCCGTTPAHIRATKLDSLAVKTVPMQELGGGVIASATAVAEVNINKGFLVVGERINPTGKKALQEEIRNGKFDMVISMAKEQVDNGANILDINMGMNGIDEKAAMLKAVEKVSMSVNVPLCIDSSHIDVIEAVLRQYEGRALINSISYEKEKFEKLIPIASKYGAMFILLPLSDKGLPANLEEKKKIIDKIMQRAFEYGFSVNDIIVDGLVTTVGANPKAAIETLETIRYCKEDIGVASIVGLSNISFGLPERGNINAAFLSMAIQNGLTMAIANPSQELLMLTAFAADILAAKPDSSIRYINRINNKKEEIVEEINPVYKAVLKGEEDVVAHIEKALKNGEKAADIINNHLIPAINEVGRLFDKKTYFLPQLITSAETMKKGIEYLEPQLAKEGGKQEKSGTVVIATVKGDIHDIGKNLVALMLKNYGFEVIDLGKDVSKEEIIRAAKEHNAEIIGLSALMTTTMLEMKNVVDEARKENLSSKIVIGGAVVTESFAKEIGADAYSSDASDAVKVVKKLLNL